MASICEVCAKGEMSGMNVSHSHLKTKRKWKPNISASVLLSMVRESISMSARVAFVPAR